MESQAGSAVPLDATIDAMLAELEGALNTRFGQEHLFHRAGCDTGKGIGFHEGKTVFVPETAPASGDSRKTIRSATWAGRHSPARAGPTSAAASSRTTQVMLMFEAPWEIRAISRSLYTRHADLKIRQRISIGE